MNPIIWQPSQARKQQANMTHFMARVQTRSGVTIENYGDLYKWSIDNSAAFWNELWDFSEVKAVRKGDTVVVGEQLMPGAKWFPDARLNYAENLLAPFDTRRYAISFCNESGVIRRLSYDELYRQVSLLAQALRNEGVKAGDRVAGVLPNMPETVVAMLAAASLGAIWSSCSPDFGVSGIADRFGQIEPVVLFVCDGYQFNGKVFDRTGQINDLKKVLPSLRKVVLIPIINRQPDVGVLQVTDWHNYLSGFAENLPLEFTPMDFDAPLFILFSSGTTGPPKCIVHSIGGTLLQHVKEHQLHADVHPGDRLFYYTTCGWMMWNWLVSGLASGAELILYDGSPLYPKADALFDLIDRLEIDIFGVSAKYIEAVKKAGVNPKQSHNLTSLKTVLSTGSPLAPESFDFVYDSINSDICLSSISGGTDIVSCFVLGCPVLPVRRGEIQCRGLGMAVDVYDQNGRPLQGEKGELVCTAPFPAMPLGFWKDPDGKRYHAAYFEKYPGIWHHGDFAALTENGGIIIYGRSDTVLNPGGIRIGTAEIYRQVEQIEEVRESLVIGLEHDNDCRIVLFVVLRSSEELSESLKTKIKQHLRQNASPHHVPKEIIQVADIPRTKTGKMAELAVRDILQGHPVRNRTALANPEALDLFVRIKSQLG